MEMKIFDPFRRKESPWSSARRRMDMTSGLLRRPLQGSNLCQIPVSVALQNFFNGFQGLSIADQVMKAANLISSKMEYMGKGAE